MSQKTFGERYFSARDRISNVLTGIDSLAFQTSTRLASPPPKSFHQPFVFIVFGEINAGKSSFLNALFGTEICPVNILPETKEIIRYDSSSHPFLPFIADFSIIDTPGTNSRDIDILQSTSALIPSADLIFFVFPVTNPWDASTWNLISAIPQDLVHRIAIIIQQSDLRQPEDIKVISELVADLSLKRIGTVLPTFPVSAKIALQAKSQTTPDPELLSSSGFPSLEHFISNHICLSPQRSELLNSWRNHASSSLRTIEENIDLQSRHLNQQNHFLNSLEDEIETMREKLVSRVPRHLVDVAEVFEKETFLVSKSLRRKLALIPSLFRIFFGDRTGNKIENLLIARLRSAVESVAESDGHDVVSACRAHWDNLDQRVRDSIGTSIAETVPINQTLEQARLRFVNRIGRTAQSGISNLSVRRDLEYNLRKRNVALKSFTATTLIFLILTASSGILDLPWVPLIFSSIAATFFLIGSIIAFITKNRVTRDFRHTLLGTCTSFADTLRTDYEDSLRSFFQEYASCLGAIRSHLANEKRSIEPNLQSWQNLFLTLKAIEQDF